MTAPAIADAPPATFLPDSPGADVRIRPFTETDADYESLAALDNLVEPEYPRTADEIRDWDARRDPRVKHGRFFAEIADADGRTHVIGEIGFGQSPWSYHPQKFDFGGCVHPDWRNRGIGARLFDTIMEAIAPHDPLRLTTFAREDRPHSLRFLQKRGFTEEMREWESRLDVRAFDFAPFDGAEERVKAHGIRITTFGQLASDPDRDRKVHALETLVSQDVPNTDAPTEVPFEQWRKMIVESPNLLPEGLIVAVHEPTGEYVGLSGLWRRRADNDLDTGLTGVRRDWRKKGIALAMKLRAIQFARQYGAPMIRTENEVNNRGMLGINERLGFVKQPAWIVLVKKIREEEPAAEV